MHNMRRAYATHGEIPDLGLVAEAAAVEVGEGIVCVDALLAVVSVVV